VLIIRYVTNDYLGGKMKVVTITIEESTLQLLKALKEETSSKKIDSYAWIEYFKGSEYGKKAKEYI
jgi:hypothetical protein